MPSVHCPRSCSNVESRSACNYPSKYAGVMELCTLLTADLSILLDYIVTYCMTALKSTAGIATAVAMCKKDTGTASDTSKLLK